MSDPNAQTIKLYLLTEHGIEGIDDSSELLEIFESKTEGMTSVERAALHIRLGQIASELEAGGPPRLGARLVAYLLFILGGWFIWRPLGAIIAIFAIASVRRVAIRNAPLWRTSDAVAVGAGYGALIGLVARLAAVFATHSNVGSIFFGVFGFVGAGYVGYGAEFSDFKVADQKRLIAQGSALSAYLVTWAIWLAFRMFLNRS